MLRGLGVRRFASLPYAHRPGIAAYLNDWARELRRARCRSACGRRRSTPSPRRRRTSRKLVADGVEVFKVHVQVGEFHLDDPLLDDVWGTIEDAGTPVVIHAGSGPVGNDVHRARAAAAACSRGTRG